MREHYNSSNNNGCPYIRDYLGNVRSVIDASGYLVEVNGYYPYGALMNTLVDNPSQQPYKYGAKELDRTAGLDLYDSQARQYDPLLGRTTTVDPHSSAYFPTSHYAWCAGNPVRYIDPDGLDWYMTNDNQIEWTDYSSQKQLDSNNIVGTYLGEAYVEFIGSRNERLGTRNGKSGYINGEGAVTATVNLYGPKNKNDKHHFVGYTMSSDPEVYGAIDEGLYPANYDNFGKSGSLKSHWVLNHRGNIRMLDGTINPLNRDQIDKNGEGYKTGVFIHSTNQDGYAGKPVSKGCLLIAPADFKKFNSVMNGVKSFKVQVTRKQIGISIISSPGMKEVIVTETLKRD